MLDFIVTIFMSQHLFKNVGKGVLMNWMMQQLWDVLVEVLRGELEVGVILRCGYGVDFELLTDGLRVTFDGISQEWALPLASS